MYHIANKISQDDIYQRQIDLNGFPKYRKKFQKSSVV